MTEYEIESELVSGGLRVHRAVLDIFQAFIIIVIALMSILISLFDIIIGFLMMWKAYLSIARFFLEQFLKKEKERRAFI